MKKLLLFAFMILVVAFAGAYPVKSKYPVRVVSSRDNVIYLKLGKELVGSAIEIYNEEGSKLLSQEITDRRVLVDFNLEEPGKYYIKVVNAIGDEIFEFIKYDRAIYSALPDDKLISVTQGLAIF